MIRDYIANPLGYIRCGSTRKREKPLKDDILELYIRDNKSVDECAKYFNLNKRMFQKILSEYGIKKDRKKVYELQKETLLKSKGVENVFQLSDIKNKSKETCLKKYGKEHYTQTIDYKGKNLNTRKEKYGNDLYQREKYRKTCMEKYGVENTFQSDIIQDKIKNVCLEKYGSEKYIQSNDFHHKSIATNKQKYNSITFPQSEKFKNLWKNKDFYTPINKKRYETKIKNKTINSSKIEEEIYKLLCEKYNDVKRQYTCEQYPYACDFYVPSKKLYIEYQGTWFHGNEPYIGTNEQNSVLNLWKNKNSPQYKRAIKTWSESDVLKRNTAKEHKLNWIEFFNMNEFLDWFNKNDGRHI